MFGITLPLLDISPTGPTTWHVHPEVIVGVILLEGLYLFALARVYPRTQGAPPVSSSQILLYTLGVLTIYIAVGTPLDDLADYYLFSAHMLQHLLLTMVAPPLFLLGMPDWLLRPLVKRRNVLIGARLLTGPFVAFIIFSLVLVFTHMPGAIALEVQNQGIHFLAHALLFGAAILMWWPVFSPLPEVPRISQPMQMVYLFIQSFVPAVLSAFIIFSTSAFYSAYIMAPRVWGLSPLDDQRIGGVIMKLGGTTIQWGVMTVIFFQWYARENRDEPPIPRAPKPLDWGDVEEELGRMGLTKGMKD